MTVTWWDSEEETRAVLDAVDDHDPDVGAGVVALGLHGLGAAALRRSAPALALDPGSVVAALDEVDLGPVLEAWRRVGGEDDDVALMKSDADVGAFRTISMLRQAGLAPEQAVERAATLYGLPAKSAVSVVAKFQAETGPAADAAALGEVMHYAAGLGSDLVSKAYERRGYHGDDPDERDESGRFAPKGAPRLGRMKPAAKPAQAQPGPAQAAPGPRKALQRRELKRPDAKAAAKTRQARQAHLAARAAPAKPAEAKTEQKQEAQQAERRKRRQRRQRRVTRGLRRPPRRRRVTSDDRTNNLDWLTEDLSPTDQAYVTDSVMHLSRVAFYTFVPTPVAMAGSGDISLEKMARAFERRGVNALHLPEIFTAGQLGERLSELEALSELEIVESSSGLKSLYIQGTPVSLVKMTEAYAEIDDLDKPPALAHQNMSIFLAGVNQDEARAMNLRRTGSSDAGDFIADRQVARSPLESLQYVPADVEIPVGEDEEDYQVDIPVYSGVVNEMDAGMEPMSVADIEALGPINKAYETRGYHGDDPDERDQGGRFAPKGAPRARGRLQPASAAQAQQPRPKEKPKKVLQRRELKRPSPAEARKLRQARTASIQARTAPPPVAQEAQAEQAQRGERRTRRKRRERRGPARAIRRPQRSPGQKWMPSESDPVSLLDLEASDSVAFIVDAAQQPEVYNVALRLGGKVFDAGDHTPDNKWRVWDLDKAFSDVEGQDIYSKIVEVPDFDVDSMIGSNADLQRALASTRPAVLREGDANVMAIYEDAAMSVAMSTLSTSEILRIKDSVTTDERDPNVLRLDDVPPAFVGGLVNELRARFPGREVRSSVSRAKVYSDTGQVVSRDASLMNPSDIGMAASVTANVTVGTKRSGDEDALILLLDRTKPGTGAEQSGLLVHNDSRVLGDNAATMYVSTRSVPFGQVAESVGLGANSGAYPANLPVRIMVVEHQGGHS